VEDVNTYPRTTTTFYLTCIDVLSQIPVSFFGGIQIIVWR
jgi:hypothetical protein